MQKFTLTTDSCADLRRSYLQLHGVETILLKRITNGVVTEELYDSDAEFEGFYAQIKKGALPKTSLLNVYELKEFFGRVLAKTEGDLVHLPLSSGLSGTCQNAILAAQELNETLNGRKIYVVDSLSASRAMGMLLDSLIAMRDEGVSAGEAVTQICELRDRQQVWAIIGDLKHLKRGGRISGFQATVGTLLGIKPILLINQKGKLVIEKTVKGERKSLEYVLGKMDEYGASCTENFEESTVYLLHSGHPALLNALECAIGERYPRMKIDKGMIGPVIGTHVGDGTVAIAFYGAKRRDL